VKRPLDPAPRFGSILPGEVMPLVEAARRVGWQKRMTINAQKMGLRSVLIGRRKYVTGDWIREFMERQAQATAASDDQADGDQPVEDCRP
jgi:hypothetical protein